MGTIAEKLQNIIDSKAAISAAIETKGGTVPTELTGYGAAIEALPSGGGSNVAAKIVDKSVTEVTSADLSGATKIGKYLFVDCQGLSSITIPDSVTNIETHAFQNCSSLTSVTIPYGETTLWDYLFSGCSGLSSVTIPSSVTLIRNYVFQNCSSLTSVTIPNSVTYIGQKAFAACTSLTSITIPNSVTATDTYVFYGCSNLTSITIGNGVNDIKSNMFDSCSSCLRFDFSNYTAVPKLASTNAFNNTNANKKIIVPDDLYETWKTKSNWNSSTNGIVGAITKASEA